MASTEASNPASHRKNPGAVSNKSLRKEKRQRTARLRAQPSILEAICECSCALTVAGGVYRAASHGMSCRGKRSAIARLTTAHHMGTVLLRASGIFFPERVESTSIILENLNKQTKNKQNPLPFSLRDEWEQMKIRPSQIKAPIGEMAIRRFEVRWDGRGLSPLVRTGFRRQPMRTIFGFVYQAPHRRFAV